jgi:hypothetical protein
MRTAPFAAAGLFALLLALPPAVTGQEDAAEDLQLQDRILAVVDEEPILVSDLDRLIGLGLVSARSGEEENAFRRRVLDDLIDQRLRFREVERFGFEVLPLDLIETQVAAISARFPSPKAFNDQLKELGLSREGLRELLAQQLLVLTYVEERLGPRIYVGIDDIRRYYDQTLVPRLRQERAPVPPLDDVREQIRQVVREQRLNEEIDQWTAELHEGANIQIFFEPPSTAELPPVVQ